MKVMPLSLLKYGEEKSEIGQRSRRGHDFRANRPDHTVRLIGKFFELKL